MNKPPAPNFRLKVLKVLLASLPGKQSNFKQQALLNLFPAYLQDLEPSSQSLARNICYGVFRNYFFLNAYIQKNLQKPLRNKDLDIQVILMASIYELLFLNTPEHAVISEWVQLCQKQKKPWSKALVNALLRNAQRNKSSLAELKQRFTDDTQNLEIKFEHPLWLVNQLSEDWPDKFESIISANNHESPMTLRVNQSLVSSLDYLDLLRKTDKHAHASEKTEGCIYLSQAVDVHSLPHFADGWVSIQDEAAQQAALLLGLEEKLKILDACSAPGGKSAHILEACKNSDLLCLDVSENRLKKVAQNLERLSLNAELKVADAADVDSWWDGEGFDRILLDAPCSASGIIRRHPDIKLVRKKEDLYRLAQQQLELLSRLWTCLKPGGLLLYATCSVFKIENELLVQRFLENQTNAQQEMISLALGEQRTIGWQLFPEKNRHDGFYYALLRKPESAP